MSGIFTKSMARNIFYGGTVFFFLLFLALTFDTERELPNRDNRAAITHWPGWPRRSSAWPRSGSASARSVCAATRRRHWNRSLRPSRVLAAVPARRPHRSQPLPGSGLGS